MEELDGTIPAIWNCGRRQTMSKETKFVMSILVLGAFLASGCALVFKGEYRDLSIQSEPGGAEVHINGTYFGRTPLKLELRANQSYMIEFRKDGYDPEVRLIKNEIGAGWLVLDVICGVVPVLVDGLTGSWYNFDQKYVNAILQSQQGHRTERLN
jgi:hypothetical protein